MRKLVNNFVITIRAEDKELLAQNCLRCHKALQIGETVQIRRKKDFVQGGFKIHAEHIKCWDEFYFFGDGRKDLVKEMTKQKFPVREDVCMKAIRMLKFQGFSVKCCVN